MPWLGDLIQRMLVWLASQVIHDQGLLTEFLLFFMRISSELSDIISMAVSILNWFGRIQL